MTPKDLIVSRHHRILTVPGILAVLAGGVACSASRDTVQRPPNPPTIVASPTVSADKELARAARQLNDTSFTLTLKVGLRDGTGTLTGRVDPQRNLGEFSATTTGSGKAESADWRVIGTTAYAKMLRNGRPVNPNKPWRRLIEDRNAGTGMARAFDGAAMAQPLAAATDVTRIDATHFTGQVDRAAAGDAIGVKAATINPNPAPSSSRTAAERTTPFTAELDAQGRLVSYQLELTNSSTGRPSKISVAYSDFGTPVTVEAPPKNLIATASGR